MRWLRNMVPLHSGANTVDKEVDLEGPTLTKNIISDTMSQVLEAVVFVAPVILANDTRMGGSWHDQASSGEQQRDVL